MTSPAGRGSGYGTMTVNATLLVIVPLTESKVSTSTVPSGQKPLPSLSAKADR